MKRAAPFLIVLGVLAATVAFGTVLYRAKQQKAVAAARAEATAVETANSKEPGALPLHERGGKDAPVAWEEFGDFECPPCGGVFELLEQFEKDYGQRLRVVFREFPLPQHKHALEAAQAAEAAGLQGKFWEMHDLLYRNRAIWPHQTDVQKAFEEYANSLKLDLERFKKDMAGEEVKARIEADRQRAASLGIDRTPGILVNNHRIPASALSPVGLRAAVEAGLGIKPEGTPTPSPALPIK